MKNDLEATFQTLNDLHIRLRTSFFGDITENEREILDDIIFSLGEMRDDVAFAYSELYDEILDSTLRG
jgi:hypothetical protein